MEVSRRKFLKLATASAAVVTALPTTQIFSSTMNIQNGPVKKVFMCCRMCAQFCPMVGEVVNGVLTKVEANPNTPYPAVCARGRACISSLYSKDRIKTPLIRTGKRGDGEFRQASWTEALDLVASKLKGLRDKGEAHTLAYMPRFNSAAKLDDHFVKVFGTPNIFSYADSCFVSATQLGLGAIYGGRPGSAAVMGDYENSKLAVMIGRNAAGGLVAFPWGAMFGRGRKNGMKTVIVDPRKPAGAGETYSDWLPVNPGTDLALVIGLMNEIIVNKYYDENFLREYSNADMLINVSTLQPYKMTEEEKADYMVFDETSGLPMMKSAASNPAMLGDYEIEGVKVKTGLQILLDSCKDYTPEKASEICGVPADQVKKLAKDLNDAKPACFLERGYRTSRYINSTREKQIISLINALLGVYGQKGGLIYGRTVKTKSPLNAPDIETEAIDAYYQKNVKGFELIGLKNMRRLFPIAVDKAVPYPIKAVFLNGLNAIGGGIGKEMVDAFDKMEFIFGLSPFWNESLMYADVILPTTTFMERSEPPITSYKATFPVISLHQKAVEPLFDSKDGYWVINQLAKRIFSSDEYETYFGEFDKGGVEYLADYALSNITGMTEDEKNGFSLNNLNINGVWCGESAPIKTKIGKTATGKMEIYSLFMAKWNKSLMEEGRTTEAEYFTPLATWANPHWMNVKDTLGDDEFIPITGFHPLSTFTGAQTRNNPLLKNVGDLLDYDAVFINSQKGKKLGLKTGDIVEIVNIEKPDMPTKAKVCLTETVAPSAMFSFYGVGAGYYNKMSEKMSVATSIGFNPNHVSNLNFAPLDGTAPAQDFIVKVRRA